MNPLRWALLVAAIVTLSWTDNSDNESGFEVQRAVGAGTFITVGTVSANSTSYRDESVANSTTYNYRVRAFNAGGNSAFSNTATVTTGAATSPPNLPPSGATATIPGTLVNLSNRGLITVGDATMIPGFTISGGPVRVLIRVVGPALATLGVTGSSDDPRLSLRNQSAPATEIAANDNWLATDAAVMAQVGAFALPAGSKDAALVITLAPGQYTVVTSGTAGIALAEIYAAP